MAFASRLYHLFFTFYIVNFLFIRISLVVPYFRKITYIHVLQHNEFVCARTARENRLFEVQRSVQFKYDPNLLLIAVLDTCCKANPVVPFCAPLMKSSRLFWLRVYICRMRATERNMFIWIPIIFVGGSPFSISAYFRRMSFPEASSPCSYHLS